MNRFVPVAAAVAALFSMAAAQAAVILVDDFNAPGTAVTISDTTADGAAVVSTTATNAPVSLAASRTMSVDLTQKSTGTANITGTVGGSDGFLNFSVSTGDNGIGKVKWTLPTFTANPGSNTFFFSVIASALGTTANTAAPNLVNFAFTAANPANSFSFSSNVNAVSFAIPGQPLNFALTGAQSSALSAGGDLVLTVSGGQGWNLILDQFAISRPDPTVPEPTSLALVGLALVGAGLASRRRKA